MTESCNENKERRTNNPLPVPHGTSRYTVQRCDTLAGIAAQFDTTTSVLKKINRLMSDLVFPGQVLYVPGTDYHTTPKSPDSVEVVGDSQIMGRVEQLRDVEADKKKMLPRPLSTEEVKKLTEQCDERFIKLSVQRILRTEVNLIPGVMLVTPDCVMFDPEPLNSPAAETGDERFSLILQMNCVMSVAIYHDMAFQQNQHISRESDKCTSSAVRHIGNDSREGWFQRNNIPLTLDDSHSCAQSLKKSFKPIVPHNSISVLGDFVDPLKESDDYITAAANEYEQVAVNAETFPSGVISDRTGTSNHVRIYLCIKGVSSGIPSLTEKITKSDKYWFSIPYDKVDQLFAFFIQWSPHLCDDKQYANDQGFIVVSEMDDSDDGDILSPKQKLCHSSSFSKDWEIVSVLQLQQKATEAEIENLPLPALSHPSDILEESHLRAVDVFDVDTVMTLLKTGFAASHAVYYSGLFSAFMNHLPARAEGGSWQLVYSANKHGFSLRTLYRHMNAVDSPVLLVIKDHVGQVFGTMQSSSIKPSDLFYGTGESYLFTFSPDFKKFRWTGTNNFFTKGSSESVCFGASKGNNGLWLDGDLYHGRTQHCLTYNNDMLSCSEDFTIECLEAWCFV